MNVLSSANETDATQAGPVAIQRFFLRRHKIASEFEKKKTFTTILQRLTTYSCLDDVSIAL